VSTAVTTRVGLIGAGTMGNGIAQVCALAGLPVRMVDIAGRQCSAASPPCRRTSTAWSRTN
jgi:3-hydroxyacyl-CoA dehydrogenase